MVLSFIERQPSFGEQFAKNLTSGFQGGFEAAQKGKADHADRVGKLTSRAYKDIPKWYKSRMGFDPSPEEAVALEDEYKNILYKSPNISEDEARNLALKSIQSREKEARSEEDQTTPEQKRNSFFNREHTPHTPADRLGPGQKLWGQIQDLGKAAKFGVTHPKETAAKFISPIAQIAQPRDQDVTPEGSKHKIRGVSGTPWGQSIENAAGIPDLSPEEHKQAEDAALLASFFPVTSALRFGGRAIGNIGKALGGIGKGERLAQSLSGAGKVAEAGAGIAKSAEAIAPAERAAIESAAKEMGLAERITDVPKTGTEARMGRLKPSEKMSPVKHIMDTRKTQLKSYPKYAEEIAEDAAKREANRLKAIPKTEVGEAGLAKRIAQAEQKLPAIQEAYTKAAARVRALENSMARLPKELQGRYQNLLKVAKEELAEAGKDLQSGLSNVRSGSTKAGVAESETAARRKLHEIETAIGEGKEYQLKGYDYSPHMIEKAKGLEKRAKLPKLKGDDFYNEIHDRYLTPYKQRLGELNQTLRQPLTPGDQFLKASKEREVIEKMIQSAEAEKIIHNHNLGLREISEAKKFNDRVKQLGKVTERGSKAEQVAQQKMWRERFTEAKSPEAKAKLIDEAAAEAAAKNPGEAAQIKAEAEMLKEDVASLQKTIASKPSGTSTTSGAGTGGTAGARAGAGVGGGTGTAAGNAATRTWFNNIGQHMATMMGKYGKRMGINFMAGIAAGVADEALNEALDADEKWPFATGATALVALATGKSWKGQSGSFGAGYVGSNIGRKMYHIYQTQRAKGKYLSKDPEKRRAFHEEKTSIQNRAKKKIEKQRRKEYESSR